MSGRSSLGREVVAAGGGGGGGGVGQDRYNNTMLRVCMHSHLIRNE